MERIDRVLLHLASQDIARRNASQASAKLRMRRHEQDDVDAYLEALPRTKATTAHDAHGSPNSEHGAALITDTP
jgi:hypothetical protein